MRRPPRVNGAAAVAAASFIVVR